MKRHLEQQLCPHISGKPNFHLLNPPQEAKQKFIKAAAYHCAYKLVAPESLKGFGTTNFIQTCIDIGVSHGRVNAAQLLSHPQTISKQLAQEAKEASLKVAEEIRQVIHQHRLAVAVDGWKEDHSGVHFLGAMGHYIDDSWRLLCRLLFCLPLPTEDSSGLRLRSALGDLWEERLGLSRYTLQKVTWVSCKGVSIPIHK